MAGGELVFFEIGADGPILFCGHDVAQYAVSLLCPDFLFIQDWGQCFLD